MPPDGFWILKNRQVVRTPHLKTWGKWFADFEGRRVAHTDIGKVFISTVCLGIAHGWNEAGQPLLFETMIFGGLHDHYTERTATWDEAQAAHNVAVELVRYTALRVIEGGKP
jgi:hypothetical protein